MNTHRTVAPPAPLAIELQDSETFQTGNVVTITGSHFIHDTYTAFLSPLLPQIIEKLSISLTQAGSLSALMQIPSLLNPFIGYLDDKVNLRIFVILAPAVTATMMSAIGIAPSYEALLLLLLITGLSSALFHATSPSLVARISGQRLGKGMSFFMAGGELGRTVGPLIAVWAASHWALEGITRLMVLGWGASLVMYLRLRGIRSRVARSPGIRAMFPQAWRLFIVLAFLVFTRSFLIVSLSFYLPTLLESEGVSLVAAGRALAIYQAAGVAGAFLGGTLSDRLGQRTILFAVLFTSPFFSMLFLQVNGWVTMPLLIILGLLTLSSQPILLALVQDQMPEHRSVANGLYMAISFITMSITSVLIGAMGDAFGLRAAFFWSAVISIMAAPAVLILPRQKAKRDRNLLHRPGLP